MKRVLTALVLIPSVCYVILKGPDFLLLAVLAAVGLLCFHEYAGIVGAHGISKPGIAAYAAGAVLVLPVPNEPLVITSIAVLLMALSLRNQDLRQALPDAAASLFGIIYIFATLKCAVGLRNAGAFWLLFALGLNWIGDSAAYYVGRSFGKHRLAPRISPGKSVEGAIASVVASVIFGLILLPRTASATPIPQAILFSVVGNAAGQIGDLAESAIKRGAGVKDSGTMLPGHGGWLDRVDSSLFSMPAVYLLLQLGL